jgi:hypothetical protein
MVQRLFADVINDAIWFMNIHEENHPWFLAMCWSLFVILYFLFWSLCCLFFFDIPTLIAPLVSSNSSLTRLEIVATTNHTSFPVVDWFCLFIYLWVLTFPL